METKTIPQMKVRSSIRAGEGGGYVGGVYYPDMSGTCSTGTAPPPTTTPPDGSTGGGYVGGVYYPDMSGTCA